MDLRVGTEVANRHGDHGKVVEVRGTMVKVAFEDAFSDGGTWYPVAYFTGRCIGGMQHGRIVR